MAVDLQRAGGMPQVLKILLNIGLLYGDCHTITGRTLTEALAAVSNAPRTDQDVIMFMEKALYREGHLAILKEPPENGAVARSPA